jgi:hypothetical protein
MLFSSLLSGVKPALQKAELLQDLNLPSEFEPTVPVLLTYPGGKVRPRWFLSVLKAHRALARRLRSAVR